MILEVLFKLGLAVAMGSFIGFERERLEKPAGLRTHTLVTMAACLLSVLSVEYFPMDEGRIAQGVIMGMGFLGAGTIISQGKNVKGLTTAASLWLVAGVGLAIGVGAYFLSIVTSILAFVILEFGKFENKISKK